jgi:hypothetical protein
VKDKVADRVEALLFDLGGGIITTADDIRLSLDGILR